MRVSHVSRLGLRAPLPGLRRVLSVRPAFSRARRWASVGAAVALLTASAYAVAEEGATEQAPAATAPTEQAQPGDESLGRQLDSEPFYDYVLVGGGVASYTALQEILKVHKDAKVLLIGGCVFHGCLFVTALLQGNESHAPYWRPPLTKQLWMPGSSDADLSYLYEENGARTTVWADAR
jgi:hypothetical protein